MVRGPTLADQAGALSRLMLAPLLFVVSPCQSRLAIAVCHLFDLSLTIAFGVAPVAVLHPTLLVPSFY